MTQSLRRVVAAALALALATPAAADLTAEGLYDLWQGQAAEQGRSVTAGEVEDTDTGIVLRDLSVTQAVGPDTLTLVVPALPLDEADGAVTAKLAAGQMLTMTLTDDALGRTVGWIAQWKEMIEDPEGKIGRPRQLYTGATTRDYVDVEKR